MTWVAATGGHPIGLGTYHSCPACANKFLTRVNRKSLCEIFLPPHEKKKTVAVQNGQVKQMEEQFLCALPCAAVDRIRICHSSSLMYVAYVAVIIRHNLRHYGPPIIITEITLYRCIVHVCQNTYITFVPPQYCRQVTPSPRTWRLPRWSVILLGPKSCGMPFLLGLTVPQQ